MTDLREPESLLPLSPLTLHILLALGSGPSHGYAIGKEAEERTMGRLNPTTGGLYLALRRLRDEGLVLAADRPPSEGASDSRRQYFELTSLGRRVLVAELRRLKALVVEAEGHGLLPRSV